MCGSHKAFLRSVLLGRERQFRAFVHLSNWLEATDQVRRLPSGKNRLRVRTCLVFCEGFPDGLGIQTNSSSAAAVVCLYNVLRWPRSLLHAFHKVQRNATA